MKKFIWGWVWVLILGSNWLEAGGPWLVYKSLVGQQGSLLVLNLGYDSGPQFAFTEADSDEEVWLEYNPKNKTIWKHTYDGDNTSNTSNQNQWHRLSWGRQGNTFALLYSQYEVVGSSGVADHGVLFGTGTCVAWPNKGKNIGVTGKYPSTINISMLRLDGEWQNGSAIGTGSRQVKAWKYAANLDVALTKALNDAGSGLSTNLDAKNWIISYFVNSLGYTQASPVNDD